MSATKEHATKHTFRDEFAEELGEKASKCYQCGKCTAGCPMAFEMDYTPNQIIRFVQLNMKDKALSSKTIWLCASCETCTTRCPKEFDIAAAMDVLRQMALKEGTVHPDARDILAFHNSFLDSIRAHGRLYEIGLVRKYKMRTWHFLEDSMLAPVMFFKGKLGLLPDKIENTDAIKRMFEKCK